MRSLYSWALVASTGLLASGCIFIEDRSERYQQEQLGKPLEVPEWLGAESIDARYRIPEASRAFVAVDEYVVPPPPAPDSDLSLEQFVIKSVGEDVWLSVGEPPGKVWPGLIRFLQEGTADILLRDNQAGKVGFRLDAGSFNARSFAERLGLSGDQTHYLLAEVVQGIRRNSSEIRLNGYDPEGAQTDPEPVNRLSMTARNQALDHLKNWFEDRVESPTSYSLAAQSIAGVSRADLLDREGEDPYLSLDVSLERAWMAVGESLQAAGVTVVDRNWSEREYLVRFSRNQTERASTLLQWLDWSSDDLSLSDDYNYRVRLTEQEQRIRVHAEAAGAETDKNDRLALLNAILDKLS